MGSLLSSPTSRTCGIDSVQSIDRRINPLVFPAPKSDNNAIEGMLTIKSGSGIEVSALIVTPKVKLSEKYVIFSHGNGSDLKINYEWMKSFSNLFGVDIISYDYPSYGLTRGIANEQKCVECLAAVVEHVSSLVKKQNIILMAHSLGTGIVIDYVSKCDWKNVVILISPYKSIPRVMLDSSFSDSLVQNYNFASFEKMHLVNCPVKIFHGEKDLLILISHGKEIYDKLKDKSLAPVWIREAGHNDILYMLPDDDVFEALNY
jgi:pimeloyl-ACP methyl ester carboxylesterase